MFKWIIIFALYFQCASALAQPTAGEEAPRKPTADSTFIFEPAEPLRTLSDPALVAKGTWGIEIAISESGFGGGAFFNANLDEDYSILTHLFISGKRATDEFEYWNPDSLVMDWMVPNKINRLFTIPLMVGLQRYLFRGTLSENFKPYVFLGAGPTLILSTPYVDTVRTSDGAPRIQIVDWFSAWQYAKSYIRPGFFGGIGAHFTGAGKNSILGVNIRYYYIPFGGKGLESVKGIPIKNFGGLILSITLGATY